MSRNVSSDRLQVSANQTDGLHSVPGDRLPEECRRSSQLGGTGSAAVRGRRV